MKLLSALALGLALALPAGAQEAPEAKEAPKPAPMEVPKPGPEAERLQAFVGTWTVEETHEPGAMGPAGKGHGLSRISSGPGGFSIHIHYRSGKRGTMPAFTGESDLAWDAASSAYKQSWLDSMTPGLMVSSGRWEGDKLVMGSEGSFDGKPFKMRDTISDISKDGFTVTSEMAMGDGPMRKMVTLVHHRLKKAAEKKEEPKKAD